MIIDTHAHFTTAPPQLEAYRGRQIAMFNRPSKANLKISDDEMREALLPQLGQMEETGTDKLIFSPRASGMGHEFGDKKISQYWTEACNDLIYRACQLYPDKLIPGGQLPQSPGVSPEKCIPELERIVNQLGFVVVNVNPDVSGGGQPFTPPISDEWWYPLWEAVSDLDVPVLFHATSTINPALHLNGSHYTNTDAAVTFELAWSDIFDRFPKLKAIVPHGGGNVGYQFNRYRSLHTLAGKKPFEEAVKNIYFDTALYDQDSIEMLISKVGVDNVIFAAEIAGTGKAIDPLTGKKYDDTISFIKNIEWLSEDEKDKVFHKNAQKLFTRANF